jgi:hypothetical protein
MTEIEEVAVVEAQPKQPSELFSLPFLGGTTIEDASFYGVLAAATLLELIAWPTAGLIGGAHALHQRARNLVVHGHERGKLIEGALEAEEGVL